jgi:hypothetical protein
MDPTAFYYLFSTVAQTLSAFLALGVGFYVLSVQLLKPTQQIGPQSPPRRLGSITLAWMALLAFATLSVAGSFLGIMLTPRYHQSPTFLVFGVVILVTATLSLIGIVALVAASISLHITLTSE